MKIVTRILLPVLILLSSVSLFAQTADEIVNKHIEAIGGKDKISQIKSLHWEGTVQVMGNENPSSTTILNGKGFRTESEFNGSKFVQVYTDKGGWMINPMAGGSAEAMPEEQYKTGKSQMDIGGQLLDYAAKGNTVELQGKDNGAYKLKLTASDKSETTYLIDASTYYVTKVMRKGMMQGQETDITITFSNFQKTDFGYVMPYTIETDFGGNFSLSSTIKKVEINKDVDPKIFDMPK